MTVVSMSKKEFDRLEVLLGVRSGCLRVADACELLGLKRRQVFRLLASLKHGGAASLVSKRCGRPSNNRLPEAYRDLALSLVREPYADFGPTLAGEKLAAAGAGNALSRALRALGRIERTLFNPAMAVRSGTTPAQPCRAEHGRGEQRTTARSVLSSPGRNPGSYLREPELPRLGPEPHHRRHRSLEHGLSRPCRPASTH